MPVKNARSRSSRARKSTGAASARDLSAVEVRPDQDINAIYTLRLYVAGQTPKSISAFANLKKFCEEYLPGAYRLEVIDLTLNPELASGDQILALPTLVRKLPPPLKRIIGNLSDTEKLLVGMDIKPRN